MLSTTFRAAALALTLSGLAACASDPLNTAGRPDGTPGNPAGTEATRANARAGDPLNTANRPDGTPGNPSGTAVSRANTRAGDPLNVNGTADCTPGNPPGTAVSRALGTTDPNDCRPARRMNRRSAARRTPVRRVTPAAASASPSAVNSSLSDEAGRGSAAPPTPSTAFSTQGR